jgi:hypothetical protein
VIKAVLFDLFETLISESELQSTRASSLGATLGVESSAYLTEWKSQRPRVVIGEVSFAEALSGISERLLGGVDPSVVERICDQRRREK